MKYLLVGLFLISSVLFSQEYIKEYSFQITIDSDLKAFINPKEDISKLQGNTIVSHTEYQYSNKYLKPETFEVYLKKIATKTWIDQKLKSTATLTIDGLSSMNQAGKLVQIKKKDHPGLAKQIAACFEKAICTITLSEDGKEERQPSQDENAKLLLMNGIVENTRLFHPNFSNEKEEWTLPFVLSMGNGGFATGNVTYKKVSEKDGRIAVEGNGTLLGTVEQSPLTAKNMEYKIQLTQEYSIADKEWVSGKMIVEMSGKMTSAEDSIDLRNTMTITFIKE